MKNKSTQEKVVLELLTNLDTWVSGDYLAKSFKSVVKPSGRLLII